MVKRVGKAEHSEREWETVQKPEQNPWGSRPRNMVKKTQEQGQSESRP